jgi:hypothetical protein
VACEVRLIITGSLGALFESLITFALFTQKQKNQGPAAKVDRNRIGLIAVLYARRLQVSRCSTNHRPCFACVAWDCLYGAELLTWIFPTPMKLFEQRTYVNTDHEAPSWLSHLTILGLSCALTMMARFVRVVQNTFIKHFHNYNYNYIFKVISSQCMCPFAVQLAWNLLPRGKVLGG